MAWMKVFVDRILASHRSHVVVALAGVILLLSASNCKADTAQAPVALGSFVFFSQPDGNPIINVKVDGRVAGIFALDTGTSYDTISSSFAAKLGLKVQTVLLQRAATPNGPPQSFQATIVPSLTAGSMTWTNRPMVVLDDQRLDFPPDVPMDGIIGLGNGSLTNYAVLIDPGNKSVTMYDSKNLTSSSITQLEFDANASIPITLSHADGGTHVRALAQNDGHTAAVDLVLDTCDDTTQIPRSIADILHLKLRHRIKQPTMFSGNVKERECTIQELTVGNVTVSNLSLVCLDKDVPGYPPSLGRDVLFQCRVLFDFPDSKMYLAPPSSQTSSSGSK